MGNTTRGGRGKQVSATVSPELYSALDDYAWENRRNRTDVVRQAVEEFAERNGLGPKREPNKIIITDRPSQVEDYTLPSRDNEVHHEA